MDEQGLEEWMVKVSNPLLPLTRCLEVVPTRSCNTLIMSSSAIQPLCSLRGEKLIESLCGHCPPFTRAISVVKAVGVLEMVN
jgi:hypothetical protein